MKNNFIKFINGKGYVPAGLSEMNRYFYHNGPIFFDIKNEEGIFIAVSNNFRHGSIITDGVDMSELDKNIKDAILTSFDIPSSYAKEAAISNIGDKEMKYAIA